ncbi:MAG: HAMP domain-containing sensor histidine kinase [Acidobacteriota bacterium]
MSERSWFRSLYWRIAVGFVAFLAVLLTVQAAVFLWLAARETSESRTRTPFGQAALVASDLGTALETEPALDIQRWLRNQYGDAIHPVAVVLPDNQVFVSHAGVELPVPLVEAAQRRLRMARRLPGDPAGRPPGGPFPGRPPGEPGGRGMRQPMAGIALVVSGGRVVAAVVALVGPVLPGLLRSYGPWLLAIALGLTLLGTGLAALVIFRPAHRRLRQLEDAARRFGSGDTASRAPDAGGDEISAVARAFNQMAGDLAARANALRESDQARRQLLADVSHELRTPLTAIRGYLETLSMSELDIDEARRVRYVSVALEEADRLERIVGDLLDLARLDAGAFQLEMNVVEVADLFRRVADRHEKEASARGVQIRAEVGPGAESVRGDAGRLEQALQNVAANALRHARSGGLIHLRSTRRAGDVVLAVHDSGEGIAPEHLERIFDRFYKGDHARGGEGRGSGLGLSIVKAIVEGHGGRVTARSTPGVETVFELALPAAEHQAPDA